MDEREKYLISIIPTDSNTSEILDKIIRTLSKMRLPRRLDRDNLAHDIWLEAWTRKKPVTSTFIRHRAINSLHRLKEEIEVYEIAQFDPDTTEIISDFENLMSKVTLTFEQIKVIHMVFDNGMRMKDIALELGMTEKKASDTLHLAIERLQAAARGMR